jgi:hypothetical protein
MLAIITFKMSVHDGSRKCKDMVGELNMRKLHQYYSDISFPGTNTSLANIIDPKSPDHQHLVATALKIVADRPFREPC